MPTRHHKVYLNVKSSTDTDDNLPRRQTAHLMIEAHDTYMHEYTNKRGHGHADHSTRLLLLHLVNQVLLLIAWYYSFLIFY